ncbi:MAG: helix-turn-helix transcriptional regulator, partial [Bacillota bacterium]
EIEELADGRLIMEFTTCSINEIKQWILGFGADVKVLAPEKLKLEVKKEVEKMREMYDEN